MGWREDSLKKEDSLKEEDSLKKEEWKWGRMGLVRSLLGCRKASEQDEEELKER